VASPGGVDVADAAGAVADGATSFVAVGGEPESEPSEHDAEIAAMSSAAATAAQRVRMRSGYSGL
jgi:hypothetical protein